MILDLGLAVRLVVNVRSHAAQTHGCQEWEGHGVQAALIATEGAPGIVLAAALIAAEDATLRLPSAGAFRAHWPKNATAAPPPPSHNVPCPDHPLEHDMPCPVPPSITPQRAAELAAEVRAAIAAAPPYVSPVKRVAR